MLSKANIRNSLERSSYQSERNKSMNKLSQIWYCLVKFCRIDSATCYYNDLKYIHLDWISLDSMHGLCTRLTFGLKLYAITSVYSIMLLLKVMLLKGRKGQTAGVN